MEVETILFVTATVVLLLLTTVLTMPKGAGGTSSLAEPGLDVIGDVHGQAGKLERLLARMGYRERAGGWSHPTRRAVFVGDLVDGQGERQVDTVRIARAMVDSGAALIVAGNHEFNAVAWHLGERDYSDKNRRQHERFLAEVEEGSVLHGELVGWFKGLPLWLEVSPGEYGVASERGLRVVHACWDPRAQRTLRDSFGEVPRMSEALVTAASVDGSDAWEAVEHLLKGPELPVDPPYLDKGGHERDQARFRWWDGAATTLDRAVQLPGGTTTADGEPYPELPATSIDPPVSLYSGDEPPVVHGHYWLTGDIRSTGPTTACVDYSAGRGGKLVAYRWSGESEFDDANFVASE